jgi:type I restriction enzyme S subunit
VPPESIILSTRAPIGNAALAGTALCTNQGCKALVPQSKDVVSRYFFYQIQSLRSVLNSLGNGTTFLELSNTELGTLKVYSPERDEQQAVAEFLDRETYESDLLFSKYESLVELLEERRAGLINRAVTNGLKERAPIKDSGVDWIGSIPAHWVLTPLKHVVGGLTVGIVVTPAAYYVDEGIPCLRSANVSERSLSLADLVFISEASNLLHKKSQIHKGDIVIVRTGRPGTAAVVDANFDKANCIDLIIARKSKRVSSDFLAYYLNSNAAKIQFALESGGALQQHFNVGVAGSLAVCLPPLDEQVEIVHYLDEHCSKLNSTIASAQRAMALLQERREALISSAIAGDLDVSLYKPSHRMEAFA